MTTLLIAVILLALSLVGIVVRKTYLAIPAKELQRRARKGDHTATVLYRAVAYGASLRGLLWLFIALTGISGLVVLSRAVSPFLSFTVAIIVVYVAFSWIPAGRISRVGRQITLRVTPPIVWILGYAYPVLSRAVHLAQRRHSNSHHTGVFERDDLLDLITQQQTQHDSRMSVEELDIARRALSFNEFTVADVLMPRKQIPLVKPDALAGPILIDELHKTEQAYALVRDTAKTPFVGTLDIARLGLTTAEGTVRDIMDDTVYYVHEDDTLSEALHVFFETNHAIFIVVNSFEEYVGIVSVKAILKQLLGHIPGDDFDQYSDASAVAARHTVKQKVEKPSEKPEKVLE